MVMLYTNVMKGTPWLERTNSPALLQAGHLQPLNVKVTPAPSSALWGANCPERLESTVSSLSEAAKKYLIQFDLF